MEEQSRTNGIGTLNEKPLHEALKQWYAQSGDRFEVPVDGFVVDIVRGDLLIEVQTRNVAAIGAFLPSDLAEPFTTGDLAAALAVPRPLAQKMAYCLRRMGFASPVGTRSRAVLYGREPARY